MNMTELNEEAGDRPGINPEVQDLIENETDLELLELQDQADEVGFLTPREYAKLRKMAPQLVYYYIRQGVVETERCKCGRKVIDVKKADEALHGHRRG